MSESADGILFYGYAFEDEERLFKNEEGESEEWIAIIARQRGIPDPWDDYPKGMDALPYPERRPVVDAWIAANRGAIDAFRDAKKAIKDEFGCDDGYMGDSDGGAVPYIYCDGSRIMAYDYSCRDVTDFMMSPHADQCAEWDRKLDAFMAALGLDKPHATPRWFLTSSFG